MRYFFEIAYKGTRYHGWQIQKNAVSIQQIYNEALSLMLGEQVETLGSSRTDTGVHANQQYFHLDTEKNLHPEKLKSRLNSFLPNDLTIISIRPVKKDAHARFDAASRSYVYQIIRDKDPFLFETAAIIRKQLDVRLMDQAAKILIGEHDFCSFCRNSKSMDNHRCTVTNASWKMKGNLLTFSITANRFLRGMVRSLVGTLLMVGDGRIGVSDFQRILKGKNRKLAGPAAPAKGLSLVEVKYPHAIFDHKRS